ncbi:MAG: cytochrome b [Vicinamibacterales bacterium]
MSIPWRNTAERFGGIAQLFHWAIVALIITQFVLASFMDDLPLKQKIATINWHKWLGMTVLMLAVLRVLWRLTSTVPPLPSITPAWQRLAAHGSHTLLYALIFLQPLSGWLMSSARNFPVSWFGLFTFPDLISPDRKLYERLHDIHEMSATALLIVAVVHALAALKHHFYDRDNVLRRMLPVRLK